MNRPTCETCPFWDRKGFGLPRDPNQNMGACHFNAPTPHQGPLFQGAGVWPDTSKDDFCGQHPQFSEWRQAEIAALDEKERKRCHVVTPEGRCTLSSSHNGAHVHDLT